MMHVIVVLAVVLVVEEFSDGDEIELEMAGRVYKCGVVWSWLLDGTR